MWSHHHAQPRRLGRNEWPAHVRLSLRSLRRRLPPARPASSPRFAASADGVPEVLASFASRSPPRRRRRCPRPRHQQRCSRFRNLSFDEIEEAAVGRRRRFEQVIAVRSSGPVRRAQPPSVPAPFLGHSHDIDDATIQEMVNQHLYVPAPSTTTTTTWSLTEKIGYGSDSRPAQAFIDRRSGDRRRAHEAGAEVGHGLQRRLHHVQQKQPRTPSHVEAGMTPEPALPHRHHQRRRTPRRFHPNPATSPLVLRASSPVEGGPLADVGVAINNIRWVMESGS